jgi:sulfite reductase beta subunit-like hemoprotein
MCRLARQIEEAPMHRHTVMFNFKDETPQAERDRVIAALKQLGSLPTVKAFMVGKNILPAGEKTPFEWLMLGDFANEDDRQAYEKHETHVHIIRKDWLPVAKNYIVLDVNT